MRVLIVIAAAYVVAAMFSFRFAHPELTETQLFTRIPDALMWHR